MRLTGSYYFSRPCQRPRRRYFHNAARCITPRRRRRRASEASTTLRQFRATILPPIFWRLGAQRWLHRRYRRARRSSACIFAQSASHQDGQARRDGRHATIFGKTYGARAPDAPARSRRAAAATSLLPPAIPQYTIPCRRAITRAA